MSTTTLNGSASQSSSIPTPTLEETQRNAAMIEALMKPLREYIEARAENVKRQKEEVASREEVIKGARDSLGDVNDEVENFEQEVATDPDLEEVREQREQNEKWEREYAEECNVLMGRVVALYTLLNIPLPDWFGSGKPVEPAVQTTKDVSQGGLSATLVIETTPVPVSSVPVPAPKSEPVRVPSPPVREEEEETLDYQSTKLWEGLEEYGEELKAHFQASFTSWEGTPEEYVKECDAFYKHMEEKVHSAFKANLKDESFLDFVASAWLAKCGWTTDASGRPVKRAPKSPTVDDIGLLYSYASDLVGKGSGASKRVNALKAFTSNRLATIFPPPKSEPVKVPAPPESEDEAESEEDYTPETLKAPPKGEAFKLEAYKQDIAEFIEEARDVKYYQWDEDEKAFTLSEEEQDRDKLSKRMNGGLKRIAKGNPSRFVFTEIGGEESGRYCIRNLDEDGECASFYIFTSTVWDRSDDEEDSTSAADASVAPPPPKAPLKPVKVEPAPKGRVIRKDYTEKVDKVIKGVGVKFTQFTQDGVNPIKSKEITYDEAKELLKLKAWVLHDVDGIHYLRNPGTPGKEDTWVIFPSWVRITPAK